jgi:hypothetical protein
MHWQKQGQSVHYIIKYKKITEKKWWWMYTLVAYALQEVQKEHPF